MVKLQELLTESELATMASIRRRAAQRQNLAFARAVRARNVQARKLAKAKTENIKPSGYLDILKKAVELGLATKPLEKWILANAKGNAIAAHLIFSTLDPQAQLLINEKVKQS